MQKTHREISCTNFLNYFQPALCDHISALTNTFSDLMIALDRFYYRYGHDEGVILVTTELEQ